MRPAIFFFFLDDLEQIRRARGTICPRRKKKSGKFVSRSAAGTRNTHSGGSLAKILVSSWIRAKLSANREERSGNARASRRPKSRARAHFSPRSSDPAFKARIHLAWRRHANRIAIAVRHSSRSHPRRTRSLAARRGATRRGKRRLFYSCRSTATVEKSPSRKMKTKTHQVRSRAFQLFN